MFKNQKNFLRISLVFLGILTCFIVQAQSTSWKGTNSTSWTDGSNWTNGIPTSAMDAIVGDANFTGAYQPKLSSTGYSQSLTIGGVKAATVTVSSTLTISGNLTINNNGTLSQSGVTLTVKGDWLNSGTYTANSTKTTTKFGGVSQQIGGSSITTFRKLIINAGSNITLSNNIATLSYLYVYGIFNPLLNQVTGNKTINIYSGGTLKVAAATYAGNYNTSPLTINSGSGVEYSGNTNQTIANYTYSTLIISGTGIKSLAANLTNLGSGSSTYGNIYVNEATLDIGAFTANRGTSTVGGILSVANGATLKIGGTATLPVNYNTYNFSGSSTVEYAGTAQTITAKTYGNLVLSGSSGAVAKTFPATAFTIAGNLVSNVGLATSVSYTTAASLTINGNVNIGAGTTFSGGSNTHSVYGDWINNGTFTGSTGTVTMTGLNNALSGSGTHNFNNLNIPGDSITVIATTITVAGNLTTTGLGTLKQTLGSSIYFTGAASSISGTQIYLNDVYINGTVTAASSFEVSGNFSVASAKSFITSAGQVVMTGAAKTISNSGTLTLSRLKATGSISTASSFSISSGLEVTGSLTATAGSVTFTGSNILSGKANLNNVIINGTSLQLATDAVLGIAGTYTLTAGTLNVTSTVPNTVEFNGSGAQTIPSATFHNLTFSGFAKTAGGAITTNGNLLINLSCSFVASTFTHTLKGNFTNNGTFTAGSGTLQFSGSADATIDCASVFNIITLNKSSASNTVSLIGNITVGTLNMTLGNINTGTNVLTITTTRNGAGSIFGSVQRTHAFTTGVAYAFAGQYNTINFSIVAGVTSVLVKTTPGGISDFPYSSSIKRLYDISIPSGTYLATLSLQYEDAELDGNIEDNLKLWKFNSTWGAVSKTSNSNTSNYVTLAGISALSTRWTLSDDVEHVVNWNGSVSSNWATPANWTVVSGMPTLPPAVNDVAQIGYLPYINTPQISTVVNIKKLSFGSTQASTLSLTTGGSLIIQGQVSGVWSANANHTINNNAQNVTINGDALLSDGIANHSINLNVGSGSVTVNGSINQSGNAAISFSGNGNLAIGTNYLYTAGTFAAGTGTVTYTGTVAQTVAPVAYNNLTINKTAGIATIASATTVNGAASINAGQLEVKNNTSFNGNTVIAAGATLYNNNTTILVGGNWTNSGTYNSSSGSVNVNGSGAQSISATAFNNLTINKPAGTASLTGNVSIAGGLSVLGGIFNLGTFNCNRTVAGGSFAMSGTSTLQVGAAANFPANFTTNTLASTSTVDFNGTVTQTIPALTYGNLLLSNGSTNAKTFSGNPIVNGDFNISSGATCNAGANTINAFGNWVNNGTFTQATSTINLRGSAKTISGNTTFNKLTVNGSYTVNTSNINTAGLLLIPAGGNLEGGSGIITLNSDVTNNGTFTSAGTVTFAGTTVQNIQFTDAQITNLNVVNFNGTTAPVFSGNSTPTYNTVTINNTAPIAAATNWNVNTAFTVATGATFTGNSFTHSFYGAFTNNGTVTSSGIIQFLPTTSQNIKIKGTTFTSTGDVKFGGSGAITITGTANTLTGVIISNTTGVTPSAALTISQDLIIQPGGILNASTFSHTVAGNLLSAGTLNGGTSTFTLTGATAELSGSDFTNFYHLVITGTVTATNDYNVTGNFTNNGTYDGALGILNMTGTAASTITGSASSFALAQIGVQKSSGIAVSLSKNITGATFIDVVSGVLDLSTFTVTQDAVDGGTLYVETDGTLKISGTNSIPTFSQYLLDSLSKVEYAGSTQSVSHVPTYGNLTISTAGNKTGTGALNIRNNFTLTNGTFIPGSYVDTLGGNWLMTSGTFTNTGSTILFDGADSQYVSSTGVFNSLKLNKASGGVVLLNNNTVNNTLTFVDGLLFTSSNTLIMPAGSGISGSTQATGWVVGKLQKNVALGTNVSRTYEIGSATNYTPVTILAASVTTAGNIIGFITNSEHPNFSTLDLDINSSVNKYWSFINTGTVFTTCSVTLLWAAAELDAGVNTANLLAASYASSAWSLPTVTSPLSTSLQVNGLTALGSLAVAAAKAPTWTGSINTDWATAGNWSNSQVPGATSNATIPSGLTRYPIVGSTTIATINNLTVQSGGKITLAGTLQLYGVVNAVNGSVYGDSGTVEMKGSLAQVLAGTIFNKELYNLIINNTADVSLSSALSLTNILNVKNGALNTNNLLTLKSNSVTTARVGGVTSASPVPINGDVIVERYIAGRRKYRLITSPVTSSTSLVLSAAEAAKSIWGNWQNAGVATSGVGTIITGGTAADGFDQATSNASLYTYNQATKKYVGYTSANGKNTKQTPLKAGVGYYMFVYGDRINSVTSSIPNPTVLKQTGTLLTGNQVYNTSSAIPLSATVGNFALVGNPYACTIDWRSVVKMNISKTLWGWDANLSSTGGYVTVTATALGTLISPLSSVIAVNRYIQPGQAFYVQTTATNPQLTISESDKIDDKLNINSSVFRETGVNQQPLMAINLLYNNGFTTVLNDGVLVAFDNSFDNAANFDDAMKIAGSTEGLAVMVDSSMLSINARKFPVDNDTLSLNISKLTKTQYTLQIFARQLDSTNTRPWLYDGYLKTIQPLSIADTNYINFTIKTTDAASTTADRFKVVFKNLNVLPVTFISISAIRKNKDAEISWQVAGEANVARYELLRSADGVRFTAIATVAARGNNNTSQHYIVLDNNTFKGNNYYRVRSVDADGKQLLSKIVIIKMNMITPSVKIYPNPISDNQISFSISDMQSGLYQAVLYNGLGQQIAEKTIDYRGGVTSYKLPVSQQLPKGTYYLHVKNDIEDYHQIVVIP